MKAKREMGKVKKTKKPTGKIKIKKLKHMRDGWIKYSAYINGEQICYGTTRTETENKAKEFLELRKRINIIRGM